MKKILKTALATLFTLIMCFPAFAEKREGGFSGRSRAILTRRDVKRYPWKKRQALREELESTKEKLKRASKALAQERERSKRLQTFTPEVLSLIPKIQFMCICPTPLEFLYVYKGLSSSDNFTECDDISTDITNEIKDKLYENVSLDPWVNFIKDRIKKRPSDASISSLQPIHFFKDKEGHILCLAWCGKSPGPAAAFGANSKCFRELKHVLVCGICGCTNTELETGSVLLSKKYVLLSENAGKPDFEALRERGKQAYICSKVGYGTDPKILSYDSTCSLFDEIKGNLAGVPIYDSLNVSFSFFVEDFELCEAIQSRAEENGIYSGCIDMEGTTLAEHFYLRGCDFFSCRFVSDFGKSRSELFSKEEGRDLALSCATLHAPSVIFCFMSHNFSENSCKLIEEEIPTTCSSFEGKDLETQVKKMPEILDIISQKGIPSRSSSAPLLIGPSIKSEMRY
ncbi:MAG: hypothetical protein ACSW8C_01765 [bacterium]